MNPQELKSNFKIPPQLQKKFESMVAACMKVLYSDAFKDVLVEPSGPDAAKEIAKGAFGILMLVQKEFQGKLPGELFLPVGLYLIAEIADFSNQAGVETVDAKTIGNSMELFIGLLMNKAGATGAQIEQELTKRQQGAPA